MLKMDSRMKKATKTIITLFQDNYPEMLSTKLFLSVPRVMEVLFNLMSSFSDPVTRRKFRMVGVGNSRAALLEFIRPEQLPPAYGGFDSPNTGGPPSGGPDDGPGKTVEGELRLRPGAPEEVTVELRKGGSVTWNYVTRRDAVAVRVRIVPPAGAFGGERVVADGVAAEECGGGRVADAPEGGRVVLRFEGRGHGMLWRADVDVLYAVRVPE
jgi:hypothetical protein